MQPSLGIRQALGGVASPRETTPRPVGTPGMGEMAVPRGFRKGGRVKKTGWAKVHKGERVIPAGAAAVMGGKKPYPKGPKAKRKVKKTMDEWKSGSLRSGSKRGPKVTNQKQAVAIALNQARNVHP
jgi:hypothetical protein